MSEQPKLQYARYGLIYFFFTCVFSPIPLLFSPVFSLSLLILIIATQIRGHKAGFSFSPPRPTTVFALHFSALAFPRRLASLLPVKTRAFLGDFSRGEKPDPAGFHGIRDNPVNPWNFENPVPIQTDPVEVFAIPIPIPGFFFKTRSRAN